MNIRIKTIIIAAVALFFVGSGVSFAHEWNHRPPGKAYGWYNKYNKKWGHHRGYIYKEVYRYDYGRDQRRWRDRHYRPGRDHRERYIYKEVHHRDHDYEKHHRRPDRDEGPEVVFKVIIKGGEIF
jgi:hypothetical protein